MVNGPILDLWYDNRSSIIELLSESIVVRLQLENKLMKKETNWGKV